MTAPQQATHLRNLPYTPPYDWESISSYFRSHQIPYLETVDDSGYERVVRVRSGLGWFRVEHEANSKSLSLLVSNATEEEADKISATVRSMFDLDANPAVLLDAMGRDEFLSGVWTQHPGLRLARSWNRYESMFAAVLGQVVSVKFGRVLVRELVETAGSFALHPKTSEQIFLFPSARQIIEANLSSVRTSDLRRRTIRALAQAIEKGMFDQFGTIHHHELKKALRDIPGVGPWTAEYVAMRGFGDNDAFPATDYALKQELRRHPKMDINIVRPWRAYAAVALWKSFAEAKLTSADVGGNGKAPLRE